MEIEKLNEPVSDSSHKRAVEKKCYTKDTDKHKEYLKKHKRKIKQIQQLNESQRKSLRKCEKEKNDWKLYCLSNTHSSRSTKPRVLILGDQNDYNYGKIFKSVSESKYDFNYRNT